MAEKAIAKINRLSPILAVPDIKAATDFYMRMLGFELDWLYGDPPVHGAVWRDNVQIQFGLNPALAERAAGTQYFLFVDDVEEFHSLHRANNAQIISPLENKPWGSREYTVRDPWGYQLRFAGPEKYEKPADARDSLPGNIRIVERLPTVEEYLAIVKSVNWVGHTPEIVAIALKGSIHGAIAVDEADPSNPKTVGMLRIIGDGSLAFCIQDVAVMPSHQNQRIGTAMLETALKWPPRGAFVGLFSFKPAFYERLGFQNGGGLHRKA
jgi:uncharacterized glyoxalase superfamily protein PhnB/GNAT superfamily N-acetyltransferase